VQQYPELQEGALTSLRAALVNSDSLLSVAHQTTDLKNIY